MIFKETKLNGAYVIETEPLEDERGFFVRTFCQEEFEKRRLNLRVAQCNVSYNRRKGTLRGMHYQVAPFAEAKLVTCIAGSIYDVIVDLRPASVTYCEWLAVTLSAKSPRSMLYIPDGFAHGFQTLEDDTEVFYQMSEFYAPEYARGVRWNDPAFSIRWPEDQRILSDRDKNYPDFVCPHETYTNNVLSRVRRKTSNGKTITEGRSAKDQALVRRRSCDKNKE